MQGLEILDLWAWPKSQQVVKKCLCLASGWGVEEVMELHYFPLLFSPEYDHRHVPLDGCILGGGS